MLVQIREELREEYTFSTDSGILIDNDTVYTARYTNEDIFQIWINSAWHTIESIDFDFIPVTVLIRPMYKTDLKYRKGMYVAVYENTTDGSWIARHSDLGLLKYKDKVLKQHPGAEINQILVPYEQIDWDAAGFKIN